MAALNSIHGGFRIHLENVKVDLKGLEPIPPIHEILEENNNISSGKVPNWYSVFGECTSCPLSRSSVQGKNYREKVMQEMIHKTHDQSVFFELEPGHMLMDLEWIDRINSVDLEEPVRKVTLIHYSPSEDYCKIIRETLKENPSYFSFQFDTDREHTQRDKWVFMETLRRAALLHYAFSKNIELDIIVIDSVQEFFKNQIQIDFYLGVDYFDQFFSHVLEFYKLGALLGTQQPQLNILSCMTNGMCNFEPCIQYHQYQISRETALAYMKSYQEQKEIIQVHKNERKPYYEIIVKKHPFTREKDDKMFLRKGHFQTVLTVNGKEHYYYLDEEKYKEINKIIRKLKGKLENFQLSFFEKSGECIHKETMDVKQGVLRI